MARAFRVVLCMLPWIWQERCADPVPQSGVGDLEIFSALDGHVQMAGPCL